MIIFPELKHPEITKESYANLVSRIESKHPENFEVLGLSSDNERSLIGLKKETTGKPTIFLNASIHGDEWESAYWTLTFFELVKNPDKANPVVRKHFMMLSENYSFYLIPVVNPWGYDNNIRHNVNGIDLNRQYDTDGIYPEVDIVKQKVSEKKPVLFIDNHTAWQSKETFGVGGLSGVDFEFWGNQIIKSIRFIRKHSEIDWYPVDPIQSNKHIGRGWASDQLSSTGSKTISTLVEGARRGNYSTQEDKLQFGLNMNLLICLYADYYSKNRVMNPILS